MAFTCVVLVEVIDQVESFGSLSGFQKENVIPSLLLKVPEREVPIHFGSLNIFSTTNLSNFRSNVRKEKIIATEIDYCLASETVLAINILERGAAI